MTAGPGSNGTHRRNQGGTQFLPEKVARRTRAERRRETAAQTNAAHAAATLVSAHAPVVESEGNPTAARGTRSAENGRTSRGQLGRPARYIGRMDSDGATGGSANGGPSRMRRGRSTTSSAQADNDDASSGAEEAEPLPNKGTKRYRCATLRRQRDAGQQASGVEREQDGGRDPESDQTTATLGSDDAPVVGAGDNAAAARKESRQKRNEKGRTSNGRC